MARSNRLRWVSSTRDRPPAQAGTHERQRSPWFGGHEVAAAVADRSLDRWWMAMLADAPGGVSPATIASAFGDWWVHLLASPSKQIELMQLAAAQVAPFAAHAAEPHVEIDDRIALPQDKRFVDPAGNEPPFNLARRG